MSSLMSDSLPAAAHNKYEEEDLRSLARHVRDLVPASIEHQDQTIKLITTFHSVLAACYASASISYKVAAWNTLCGLIDHISAAQASEVSALLWQHDLWLNSLTLFISRSHDARPKSFKQLLISLANAVRRAQASEAYHTCRAEAVRRLFQPLFQQNAQQHLRSCLVLLSHMLSRDILELKEILDCYQACKEQPAEPTDLLARCMDLVTVPDCASAAANLVTTLLTKLQQLGSPAVDWIDPLKRTLRDNQDELELYRIYLLPSLLKHEPSNLKALLADFGLTGGSSIHDLLSRPLSHDLVVLLAALQTGKDCGLVIETSSSSELVVETLPIQLPLPAIRSLIQHSNRRARIAGLSLLIDSPSITAPLSKSAFLLLEQSLQHLHADVDANFRSELFAMMQRFLDRLRATTAALQRAVNTSAEAIGVTELLAVHRNFLTWYKNFLKWELRPGASYQRHISSLRCILMLLRSGVDDRVPGEDLVKSFRTGSAWPFSISVVDHSLERLLLDRVMDPFDDVRQAAAGILATHTKIVWCSNKTPTNLKTQHDLDTALLQAQARAEKEMLASGRADQADGLAHYASLLFELTQDGSVSSVADILGKIQNMLRIASTDLATAVEQYPLHGLVTSLRYILAKPSKESLSDTMLEELCRTLSDIWQVVRPTLCNDAPEGLTLQDLPEDVDHIDTKDILSYCWRALKEASLLTGVLIGIIASTQSKSAATYMQRLVELTFNELAELRHRGAFSTVAQTWILCCAVANRRDDLPSLQQLMNDVLELIQKATVNTRRSAGLPSLLCGILAADTTAQLLPTCFERLCNIARQPVQPGLDDESSLPQVHALNCCKDIIKSTRLATQTENLTTTALKLAAQSLQSSAWAVRNCGLMLFRSILDRLVGSDDSSLEDVQFKGIVDLGDQPDLLDVVTDLCHASHSGSLGSNAVFPALHLLQFSILPSDRREEVEATVFQLTKSPAWLVRDKAARTLVSISEDLSIFAKIADTLTTGSNRNNAVHGALLLLKHLQSKLRSRDGGAAITRIHSLADDLALRATCPVNTVLAEELCADSMQDAQHTPVVLLPPADSLNGRTTQAELYARDALHTIKNSEEADQWLLQRSAYLELRAVGDRDSDQLLDELKDLITCYSTVLERSSIFSTSVVAQALTSMKCSFVALEKARGGRLELQRLCFLIYDLLNDDDEDVRLLGADAAGNMLGCQDSSAESVCLEPVVAARKLLAHMLQQWPLDRFLAAQILNRAFDVSPGTASDIRSSLEQAIKQDTDLFAEEKQNLYLDEVLEAKAWSRAALRLHSSVFDNDTLTAVAKYANDGLTALLEQAEVDLDGAQGWTSSPDVFVLGLRVMYAAELLLKLSAQGVRLTAKPSELRQRLVLLLSKAEKKQVHVLWIAELERISSLAISNNTSNVGSLLDVIVQRLDGDAAARLRKG